MSSLPTIGFFLPVRKGSQRVINKNTKTFAGIKGGILRLKLQQLMACTALDEIVLSTNDEQAMAIARELDPAGEHIKVIKRPEALCLDTTSLTDLIEYVPSIMQSEHLLWGHTTTPFCDATAYTKAIKTYFEQLEEGCDSLISVCTLRNFLLEPKTKKMINGSARTPTERWPRTQDLSLIYEVNHALFIAPRATYLERKDRIGVNPFLYEQGKIVSFDIDWEEDFLIAEAIYERLYA